MVEVIGFLVWMWGVLVSFEYIVNDRHKNQVIDYHIVTIFATLSWLGIAMVLTDDMIKRWQRK